MFMSAWVRRVLFGTLCAFVSLGGAHAAPGESPVTAELRGRLQATSTAVDDELRSRPLVARFYGARAWRPAWTDAQGRPGAAVDALYGAVARAGDEGLRPADYHRAALRKLLDGSRGGALGVAQAAELELLATDAYLTYGRHLLGGRLDPQGIDKDWTLKGRSRDLVAVLQQALAQQRVAESLAELAPAYPGYARLREGLARLRQTVAAGGWPAVGALAKGERLEPGVQDPRIAEVRARLLATGELDATQDIGGDVYDPALVAAVKGFQARHGLLEDGVIGGATVLAMNVTARERVAQLELNLERWRWLPADLGSRYILINIPAFELAVFEGNQRVFEARVVVGQQVKPTPVFTGRMQQVVFSPYWNVPRSIATEELLPQLRRNPAKVAGQNIRVLDGSTVVDATAVDWSQVTPANFPYRLRQDPGAANPLGRVKFLFPNRYDVYLHDTSKPGLFERSQRTFSHGCIRVSRPLELAQYLLRHDPKWTREAIDAAAEAGRERVVQLTEEVPVHILYWTAWVDEHGVLQLRNDVYQRDRPVAKALQAT
ncbi:murein L,D-transpeptidase YcbB/YkuD [Plasticicumulans lactativorans]|uniref:Murein L,D-transpeptidase YcbB/YkuD n=2 Tax=Plasticicumulans lactativorans TaxID=1133106 RepID=A0A4R2LGB1_9GAMM|nr:murein L,D-transpeptidase YcbB/YkuD [Plasticicumulans lactativorans]